MRSRAHKDVWIPSNSARSTIKKRRHNKMWVQKTCNMNFACFCSDPGPSRTFLVSCARPLKLPAGNQRTLPSASFKDSLRMQLEPRPGQPFQPFEKQVVIGNLKDSEYNAFVACAPSWNHPAPPRSLQGPPSLPGTPKSPQGCHGDPPMLLKNSSRPPRTKTK